jgi:hypothetical protein
LLCDNSEIVKDVKFPTAAEEYKLRRHGEKRINDVGRLALA